MMKTSGKLASGTKIKPGTSQIRRAIITKLWYDRKKVVMFHLEERTNFGDSDKFQSRYPASRVENQSRDLPNTNL